MADRREARVSQGGEGRLRTVTPEENRRLQIQGLRDRRADVQMQRGWDLAMEEMAPVQAQANHYRDALEEAADDLLKAANQFAQMRPGGNNWRKFEEKAERARQALARQPEQGVERG